MTQSIANTSTAELIAAQLRELDRDAYLASLVLPKHARPPVQTLQTFAAELAAVRYRVSEPMPGEIRLQFWHDALEGQRHGDVDNNPLAKALFETIKTHQLSTVPLLRMVAARRFDLYQDPMPNENQFEGYAGEVSSIIFQYAAQICMQNLENPEQFNDAAGHLGVAQTYVRALYSFDYDCRRAQIFLPLSIFQAFGLKDGDVLANTPKDKIVEALRAFADSAQTHLDKANSAIKCLPSEAKPAFAAYPFISSDLARVQKALARNNWAAVKMSDWRKILKLMRWGIRR
ncbi:phytoene/squalene synthase family protein [Maritalea mediterranea]|uniref:Squalene/phytoene synthase family protein n=1 Tax=Maritalea mediterranea TaxID=2909667 RepID=A0ABS9E606_9HYPH|nr:squalene/phytoene synthase family protein [Maritalea mediterranea]MCF4098292.1 squalene/phytoene synthase family protein [Maritalea mediterranea]